MAWQWRVPCSFLVSLSSSLAQMINYHVVPFDHYYYCCNIRVKVVGFISRSLHIIAAKAKQSMMIHSFIGWWLLGRRGYHIVRRELKNNRWHYIYSFWVDIYLFKNEDE